MILSNNKLEKLVSISFHIFLKELLYNFYKNINMNSDIAEVRKLRLRYNYSPFIYFLNYLLDHFSNSIYLKEFVSDELYCFINYFIISQ